MCGECPSASANAPVALTFNTCKFQRTQFPLTLAFAITSHKCQGDTLEEVIIDFEKEPKERRSVPYGSFYVALTRVKEGKSVFLKSFSETYITYNKRVEEKIRAMRELKKYIIYISDVIFENSKDEFKVGYLNIQGLMLSNHALYLDCDLNLLNLDFLIVTETWLNSTIINNTVIQKFQKWKVIKRLDATDNIKHMGLLLLCPVSKQEKSIQFIYHLDYVEGYKSKTKKLFYQGLVMRIREHLKKFVFLYIQETPSNEESIQISKAFQDYDAIIGDLNLNPIIPHQKKRLHEICGKSKYMDLEEITTDNFVQLDHVLLEHCMKSNSFCQTQFKQAIQVEIELS